MSKVTGEYPDYTKPNNKSNFSLTCDKSMAPGKWLAPIKWTGRVDGRQVEFIQSEEGAWLKDYFDFSSFPNELKSAIPWIVEAIDEALRVMD